MKIPKKIDLINRTIEIELDPYFVCKENKLGLADYCKNKITLDNSKPWEMFLEETYLHELVHWILYSMGNELHKNEEFVGLFSCILHQAIKSGENK